jgi:hypothetical protein
MSYSITDIARMGPEVADRLKSIGIRTTTRLLEEGPEVVYGFEVSQAGARHEGRARVTVASGAVAFEGPAGQEASELPQAITSSLHALLRSLWRPRQNTAIGWPRRLNRWRDIAGAEGP